MSLVQEPRLGWIGLGSMGLGMAKKLQRHLSTLSSAQPLTCTNRTISRAEPVTQLGGKAVSRIAEVVEASDIIFISGIVDEIVRSESCKDKLIVDTTTIHPSTSKRVHEKITNTGATYVAAPVFGASPLAESGQLLFILGGSRQAIDRITPYIEGIMGRGYIHVGEDPSKALLVKTTGNFITAGLMEVISEAHVFAEKSGLGTDILEAVIEQNWGGILCATSNRITSAAYCPPPGERPRSDLGLAIKDVQHGITAAKEVGVELRVAEVVMNQYQKAMVWQKNHQGRQLDSSSMYGVIRQEAGLDFEPKMS